jgi:hypothetical protein
MSRSKLLGAATAVALAGWSTMAQTPLTNIFENADEIGVKLGVSRNDTSTYQLLSLTLSGDQGTDAWGQAAGDVGPDNVFDTDTLISLWEPVSSTSLNGTQALFLADLDFGQAGSLVKWGAIVMAIPEPSTCLLAALGGIALGLRFLRLRVYK